MDKAQAIATLVQQLVDLGEVEFGHVWAIIHAVKQKGTQAAVIAPLVTPAVIPQLPQE